MIRYLIYLDILGFTALAEEIGAKNKIETRFTRDIFIAKIQQQVTKLKNNNIIIGEKYGNSDDWILVTDTLENVFFSIQKIMDLNTVFIDEKNNDIKIPLEIAIGTREFDKWAKYDGGCLTVEDDAINFLKTGIVGKYAKYYKEKNKKSIKSTFIVLTESVYGSDVLNHNICHEFYRNDTTYYYINPDYIHFWKSR